MKVLLQNTKTSKYIGTGTSSWTILHEDARNFDHSLDALTFCFARRIRHMQVLMEFPDPRMNWSFQVTDV